MVAKQSTSIELNIEIYIIVHTKKKKQVKFIASKNKNNCTDQYSYNRIKRKENKL